MSGFIFDEFVVFSSYHNLQILKFSINADVVYQSVFIARFGVMAVL